MTNDVDIAGGADRRFVNLGDPGPYGMATDHDVGHTIGRDPSDPVSEW